MIKARFPNPTSTPDPYTPQAPRQSLKGRFGPGAGSRSPSRDWQASPPEPLEGGAQRTHGQVSRDWGDLCRLRTGREDPRRPWGGPPGPPGPPRHCRSSADPAATRWAGGASYECGGEAWTRSKGERRRAPSPYLEQVEVSRRNPIGGRPWRNRTLKPPEGRLGVGRPPSARGVLRAHSGRRQQPGRPGAHRGTLRACAPPPPPPRRDSARACAVRGFRATGVLRGTGSAPGRTEKACRSLGLGDSGTRGAGRLICLSESEKSSEPQDYSSTHAYCNRLGAREAERTAAVAERRQSLPGRGGAVGEKAPNSKCSAGAFRGRVLGAKRSTLLGEGKRKSSFSFSYFLRRENLETCRQQ